MTNVVHHCTALDVLVRTLDDTIDLVYIDPPFGTGSRQTLKRQRTGDVISHASYEDPDEGYVPWLREHVEEIRRALRPSGTMYLHLDRRWSHYVKVMCDEVFGRPCFLNEVVWSYNFGGRGKRCWPQKHDSILVYVKEPGKHVFNWDDIPRVPYAAPEMQHVGRSPEEAARRIASGQVPTDVWQLSIVGTASKERNGYPTQKPVRLVERAILASSPVGGTVMDVFAGSGTTGDAAHRHNRSFILADVSPDAIATMRDRFKDVEVEWA